MHFCGPTLHFIILCDDCNDDLDDHAKARIVIITIYNVNNYDEVVSVSVPYVIDVCPVRGSLAVDNITDCN